ncbi:hypothetical protein ACFQ2B_40380 [Streptomyces stramineus]
MKGDAVTHALAKPGARPDKVQQWADHKDARTTQLYNRRRELLDDSPATTSAATSPAPWNTAKPESHPSAATVLRASAPERNARTSRFATATSGLLLRVH